MRFYNILDERERFIRLEVTNELAGQINSPTQSYLSLRKTYQELGQTMGLDKRCHWKDILEDMGSTSGIHMRQALSYEGENQAKKCAQCEGYNTTCGCYAFIEKPKGEKK